MLKPTKKKAHQGVIQFQFNNPEWDKTHKSWRVQRKYKPIVEKWTDSVNSYLNDIVYEKNPIPNPQVPKALARSAFMRTP
jgi:hypothetical protein